MAKKTVPLHIATQGSFGFDVQDIDGNTPGFLYTREDVLAALDVIQQSKVVFADVETTGLTDASMPVPLAPFEIKQGAFNLVRMRTIQARVPTYRGASGPRQNFVFDCDRMGPSLTAEVARTVLSCRMFVAHNAGFDLYWLRLAEGRKTMPEFVVDTMLMTRLLDPKLVLVRADMVREIRAKAEVPFADSRAQAAWKSLITGASGGSLADVVLAMFDTIVDKTYQKPNNWTGLLGFDHYQYALDDTYWADRILCQLLHCQESDDIFQAYLILRSRKSNVRLVEPQVPELVQLRESGMFLNPDIGRRYVVRKRLELAKKVDELISIEPALAKHRNELSDPDAGLDDGLKQTLAFAFESRGVSLRRTAAQGSPQVGEKDLRACRAAQNTESRSLFNAWVAVCRAKKCSAMALEVVGFGERSADGKLRALLSHGPVTGRLSASEPNVQQWPRDQLFRAMCMSPVKPGHEQMSIMVNEVNAALVAAVAERPVTPGELVVVDTCWMTAMFWSDKGVPDWPPHDRKALEALLDAQFTHKIVASDFGALDVRVGAALCVRSQREMLALAKGIAVPGEVQPPEAVVKVIKAVAELLYLPDAEAQLKTRSARYAAEVARLDKRLEQLKLELDSERIARKVYFTRRSELKSEQLAMKLGWRFAQCLAWAASRGETEYSALRDAFVADIDIHTFTGMKLVGRDPMKEFEGLSHTERKSLEKKLKKELGPRRQQGKIANLSLLYGMMDAGFQEAAARGYDEHWTMEEAHDIRALWMDAYPEVELWHLWTECLCMGTVYLPDMDKDKPVRTQYWMARTLAGRQIVAFGLNAALSYQDQSSGADILALIMHELKTTYPHIFAAGINQVHDEQVFAYRSEHHEEFLPIIERVMVECANSLTMPYGVPCAVSPACGPIWVKD